MSAAIAPGQVIYTASNTPVAHCGGPGQAERGYLCIYITSMH
jgi:hypothetical protein